LCSTNSVVREFTANALLGLGASPIMSDATEEIGELVGMANVGPGSFRARFIDAFDRLEPEYLEEGIRVYEVGMA
jgi:hydroxyethylthiazole kinase-like sugar kinase family protein